MIRISNVKIYEDISNEEIFNIVIKKYKILKQDVQKWYISKKSIDARKKDDVHYSFCIDINVKNENKYLNNKNISKIKEFKNLDLQLNLNRSIRPVIIGAGPCGLFSALTFVQNGYKPIVIEQGSSVDERKKSVDLFLNNGVLDQNCNVQFGEGGAGTFSDGKLTSRCK